MKFAVGCILLAASASAFAQGSYNLYLQQQPALQAPNLGNSFSQGLLAGSQARLMREQAELVRQQREAPASQQEAPAGGYEAGFAAGFQTGSKAAFDDINKNWNQVQMASLNSLGQTIYAIDNLEELKKFRAQMEAEGGMDQPWRKAMAAVVDDRLEELSRTK